MNINVYGRKTTKATKNNVSNENTLDNELAELRKYNEEHHTHLSYGKFKAMKYWEQQKKQREFVKPAQITLQKVNNITYINNAGTLFVPGDTVVAVKP